MHSEPNGKERSLGWAPCPRAVAPSLRAAASWAASPDVGKLALALALAQCPRRLLDKKRVNLFTVSPAHRNQTASNSETPRTRGYIFLPSDPESDRSFHPHFRVPQPTPGNTPSCTTPPAQLFSRSLSTRVLSLCSAALHGKSAIGAARLIS